VEFNRAARLCRGTSRRVAVNTFSQPDLFIAATAVVNDLCVATRNVADFIVAEVPVLNPWTA
jgi:predicted nucleic acid-binding protein